MTCDHPEGSDTAGGAAHILITCTNYEGSYLQDYNIQEQWYYNRENYPAYYVFDGLENQLVLLNALTTKKFDPTSIAIESRKVDEDDNTYVTTIGGYDQKDKRYYCKAFYWDGKEWTQLKMSGAKGENAKDEWAEHLPVGCSLDVKEQKGKLQLAVGFRYCNNVTRTRSEMKNRTVTRYRQEYRYNPRQYYNSYYDTWVGGYEWVDVPYRDTESYYADVKYKDRAVGNTWKIYRLDPEHQRLWYSKESWMEYDSPFGEEHEEGE